jgi:hypothetical protein
MVTTTYDVQVLVVADDPLVRAGLDALLADQRRMAVHYAVARHAHHSGHDHPFPMVSETAVESNSSGRQGRGTMPHLPQQGAIRLRYDGRRALFDAG